MDYYALYKYILLLLIEEASHFEVISLFGNLSFKSGNLSEIPQFKILKLDIKMHQIILRIAFAADILCIFY